MQLPQSLEITVAYQRLAFGAVFFLLVPFVQPGFAVDELISGKVHVVKANKLVKFVSKSKQQPGETPFTLPAPGGVEDPTIGGATLSFQDLGLGGGAAGFVSYTLESSGWKGLGNPPGSKGYKYKGKLDVLDSNPKGTCRVVIIKEKVIKGVCKDDVPLSTPFTGDSAIVLGVPRGYPHLRYCAQFGGDVNKNTDKLLKVKDAPPAAGCPATVETPLSCSGVAFADACWFKGAASLSCDAVCAGLGLGYDPATRTVAGSEGPSEDSSLYNAHFSNCQYLTSLFGDFFTLLTDEGSGVGCCFLPEFDVAGRDLAPTTSAGFELGVQRYCACR